MVAKFLESKGKTAHGALSIAAISPEHPLLYRKNFALQSLGLRKTTFKHECL